ncbi:peptide/nickel transport system ATP-binding protein/oligopeptide transport system ATP-binding protein [Caldalkalibacillus uzonensis]|uniref:Peptide/nickel transport system ATP-binding protein/oligopeptide transport system ATP-binding protein n=1 Tax=Caldalkalibacillus uzonensis TaxID=353224 RepID=A0ABU0CQ42_9BACI|nr:ABC transporter ATP-binding protein [Caldalkalibacillus uzonensis]MDQ0338530.1 peptide/nickel transport system ATP-binding protein/oligopeptide transport system ATP-binding protein [Caldalkalibacillus uzonensis]
MDEVLLDVRHLRITLHNKKQQFHIVDGLSFQVEKGKTLCIVGESGCGKSLTSLAVMGLLPKVLRITDGEIYFKGEPLTGKSMRELSKLRGNELAMIFQEPMTSLNPVQKVGKQIAEPIMLHKKVSKKEAYRQAVDMLRLVGIPAPEERVHAYPHELSGGMQQRVMIALALSCQPELLIADEPTTALDVTIQAQILELMNRLKDELGMAIMMITHDLGVVAEMADDVLVMYAGKAVEYAARKDLFTRPLHPYTQGLLNCIPKLEDEEKREYLHIIKGSVPSPDQMPPGCRFVDRCPFAQQMCLEVAPPLVQMDDQQVACWKYTQDWDPKKEGEYVNAGNGAIQSDTA